MFTDHIYLVYMNKPDLALNNQPWLNARKKIQTKLNQIKPITEVK